MPRKNGALWLLGLLLVGLLAACGDATATTAPTSAPTAVTTSASTAGTTTTAAAIGGATTTAAAGTSTTAAVSGTTTTRAATTTTATGATTSATSATTAATGATTSVAGATTSATGTGSSTAAGTVPAPPNSSLITLKESEAQSLLSSLNLPGDLAKNAKLNLYVSDDDVEKLSPAYATQLTSANFKPAIPGLNEVLSKQGTSYSGVVSDGNTDAIIAATTITGDITNGTGGTLPADLLKTINDQAKGKKTGVFVISGKGLVQALFAAAASGSATGTATSGTSTTPGATPTK